MVTVLPAGTGSSAFHGLHGPHDPSAAVSFYPNVYPPHVPRVAGNSNSKAIHLRSSSMPEAVYIAKQQQAQALQAAFKPRVRHPSGHQNTHTSGIQPVMVSLRRSHTNVSDFTHGGRGVKGGGYCRPRVEPRYWNEGCELQTTGMTYALARSRSNIAALGLNPEAVYHRNPHQINQIPGLPHGHPALGGHVTPARDPKGISRASSFAYHHRDHSMQAARSLGFLASANSRSSLALPGSMGIPQGSNPNQCPPSNNNNSSSSQSCKDLSQPLHVDCSVEYDLGNQPKIPKDSAPLLIIHPGYHQQQKQKQQQEQINAATSRFHPYSLNTNQTSIPSSPFSDFATVSSDQKSKGSSGHGTSLASSSLGSSNSSTSISQHPPLACSTITRSRSRLPPGQRYPIGTSGTPGHRVGVSRHSSFLVTSPPKMVEFSTGLDRQGDNNRGQLMAEMMLQQYETPINRRSSMALTEVAAAAAAAGGAAVVHDGHGAGHRSLFHLSMPDIAKANHDQKGQIQQLHPASLNHKLTSSTAGSEKFRERGQKQPQNSQNNQQSQNQTWNLHNKKAQHRHDGSSGRRAVGSQTGNSSSSRRSSGSGGAGVAGSGNGNAVSGGSSSSNREKTRENKARQNLNAKLEAVRKLSSGSSGASSGGSAQSGSQNCDSGLGTPISLIDEISSSSMRSSSSGSQNSGSHLSKWRSSMSELVRCSVFCFRTQENKTDTRGVTTCEPAEPMGSPKYPEAESPLYYSTIEGNYGIYV